MVLDELSFKVIKIFVKYLYIFILLRCFHDGPCWSETSTLLTTLLTFQDFRFPAKKISLAP